MSLSDFVRNACHGSFVLEDGSASPVQLTSLFDLGDVQVSGLSGPTLNEVQEYERRGQYVSDAYANRRYPTITFTSYHTGEGAASPGSVQAFLTKSTPYGSNVSVQGSGRVYAVKFTLNIEGSQFGADDWSSVFNNCVPVDLNFGEAMDGDKWSITLRSRGAVTGSIAASQFALV